MSTTPASGNFDHQQIQSAAAAMRQSFTSYSRNPQATTHLQTMRQSAQVFIVHAKRANALAAARVAEALAGLVGDLQERPGTSSASVLRTLAQAVDLLGGLAVTPPTSKKDPFAGIRGFAVDDDEATLRTARAALEKAGFAVTTATSGEDALAQISQSRFHFILTDIMMPGMSGLELCAALRKLLAYQKTPVIFVTSAADFENRAQAVLSGGNDLIAKPFVFSELVLKALILTVKATPTV